MRETPPLSFPSVPWILGFAGARFPGVLAGAIREGRVAGLLLFRDNLGDSWEAAQALRGEILGLVPPGMPFVLVVDEEGGLISQTSRLRLPDGSCWPDVPTPRALGRLDDPSAARFVGRLLGRRVRSLGFAVDLAPCLDLDTERENPVIGSRSFGRDPGRVAALGKAFARGLAEAGVAACFKHFPGHGGTRQDSHRELPRMEPAEMRRHSGPFRTCLAREWDSTPWVMGAHVAWRGGVPASLHPGLLARITRWNPRALRITDALEMRALTSVEWAAEKAWRAGNDLLLVGRDWEAGLEAQAALAARVGSRGVRGTALTRLSRRARRRVLPEWVRRDLKEVRRLGPREPADDGTRLLRLHRRAVRWSASPAALPPGPWVWLIPEGLRPYADLRGWRPPRLSRRPIERIEWIPENPSSEWVRATVDRLRRAARPLLWATFFRGVPEGRRRERLRPLLRLPTLRAVAHLLDESWPESPAGGGFLTALTSGPSAESLTALAESLDRPAEVWRRGPDAWYFLVDS